MAYFIGGLVVWVLAGLMADRAVSGKLSWDCVIAAAMGPFFSVVFINSLIKDMAKVADNHPEAFDELRKVIYKSGD